MSDMLAQVAVAEASGQETKENDSAEQSQHARVTKAQTRSALTVDVNRAVDLLDHTLLAR